MRLGPVRQGQPHLDHLPVYEQAIGEQDIAALSLYARLQVGFEVRTNNHAFAQYEPGEILFRRCLPTFRNYDPKEPHEPAVLEPDRSLIEDGGHL